MKVMHRFLTIITASEDIGADWQEALVQKLGDWGLTLTPAGDLVLAGERIGPGAFHALDEVRARFGDAPWLRASCPLVGPALGALSWERREAYGTDDCYFPIDDWAALRPPLRDLVVPLMKEARGAFVRTADGASREPVRLRPYQLSYAIGKYGCDDGAELVTREDNAYAGDVLKRIGAALRTRGLSGHVGWMPTCHNPIRWSEVEVRGLFKTESRPALWRGEDWSGPPVADADAALRGLEVELWTYDFALADDLGFFAPDDEDDDG